MFPHMYKVKPRQSITAESSDAPVPDSQWRKGDSWRRNSSRWGSQSSFDSPSKPATTSSDNTNTVKNVKNTEAQNTKGKKLPETMPQPITKKANFPVKKPPSMPEPPPESQGNLARKSSITNSEKRVDFVTPKKTANVKRISFADPEKGIQEWNKSQEDSQSPSIVDEEYLVDATRKWINTDSKKQPTPKKKNPMDLKQFKAKNIDVDELLNPSTQKKPKVLDEWNDDVSWQTPKNQRNLRKVPEKGQAEKLPAKDQPDWKQKLKPASEREIIQTSKNEERTNIPLPPPPPPPPPKMGVPIPPPPPPGPPGKPLTADEEKLKQARIKYVEKIKKAARSRPDWQTIMKDIEGGIKLKRVDSCNKLDRSTPILPSSRGKEGKFFYDSENPNVKNEYLNQIHRGIKLKHVKTNDRSKPDFSKLGLRKLRRQLTVEEKKKFDPDTPDGLPSSSDEEEDIDKMRDDLSSTKEQLTEEIKKNKRLENEQQIAKIDIESLQAEVKRMKRRLRDAGIREAKPLKSEEANAIGPKLSKSMSRLRMMPEEEMDFLELDAMEEDIKILNDQIEAQRKRADKAEQKSEELGSKLQLANNAAEEWEMRSIYFEKKCKHLQKDLEIELPDINCVGIQCDLTDFGPSKSESHSGILAKKSASRKGLAASFARMESFKEEDSEEESTSSSDESTMSDHPGDDEEVEDDKDEITEELENKEKEPPSEEDVAAKREERDFIMWKNKLTHVIDKEKNVRRERNNLRERVKKFYKDMQIEREEYLKIKKELTELSDQMKDSASENLHSDDENEESEEEEEGSECESSEEEEKPEPTKFKSDKLPKITTENVEDEEDEEEILDYTGLEDPVWPESEEENDDSDEDEKDTAVLLNNIKHKTKEYEDRTNEKKKETYKLKAQLDTCEEMLTEEKWRHDRLQSELQILLNDM